MIVDIGRVTLEQELENGSANYCRKGPWNYRSTYILNNDGNILAYDTRTAIFRIVNKSGQKGALHKYRIIIGSDKKILWIGEYVEGKYFISCGEKIYEFQYGHKYIELFPNISLEEEYFDENDYEKNDALIRKYRRNMGHYRYTKIENIRETFEEEKIGVHISLDEHFEKGFFYKGFRWNKNWNEYYGYNNITIFIDIIVKNGMFCIEIENITYPFQGYVLFDLNELKIVEAKKNEQ